MRKEGVVVCVNCKRLRKNGEWLEKKADKEEFKTLGRVICSDCGPKNNK